jgi:DNA-binding NtrC family response regulator
MSVARILVVDDDDSLRRVMKMQLEEAGYAVTTAADGADACQLLQSDEFHLIITDLRMPTGAMELLSFLEGEGMQTTVIVVTAFGTVESAVEAMRKGAYDYVTKPLDFEALLLVVRRAIERQALLEEVRTLRSELDLRYGFDGIIAVSKNFLRVLNQASRVAERDATVLIQGETGTGKELIARAIHQNSRRKNRPFVAINCGAIPRELMESELFGHRKGAFTGATMDRPGRVAAADGGTLFLDEIGELPPEAQVKLLRTLQEGEISKVGADLPTHVNVRVIAATHRNLQAMVEDGTFREDLYYRLAVVPLLIPPLRERRDDLPALIKVLFERAKKRHDIDDIQLSPQALQRLISYRWPGNVRQLENVLERIVVLTSQNVVTEQDLPEELLRPLPTASGSWTELPEEGLSLEAVERDLILRALDKFAGNQTHAARYLDISRRTLIYRMEKHGLIPATEVEAMPEQR